MRKYLTFLLIVASSAAWGADDAKTVLARRLVALQQVDAGYKELDRTCPEAPGVAAKNAYMRFPFQFGGISPQSAYWPEVEQVYEKFGASACQVETAGPLSEVYVKVYAESLSVADLRAIVDFYASPAGKHLQDVEPAVSAALKPRLEALMSDFSGRGNKELSEALATLSAKYKADPR